jgi:hypothetical protein
VLRRQLVRLFYACLMLSMSIGRDVVYDPGQSHLKIIVVGPPAESVELLMLIRVWLEQLRA